MTWKLPGHWPDTVRTVYVGHLTTEIPRNVEEEDLGGPLSKFETASFKVGYGLLQS